MRVPLCVWALVEMPDPQFMLQCGGPEIAPGGRPLLAATVTLPAGVLGWGTGVCGCVVRGVAVREGCA